MEFHIRHAEPRDVPRMLALVKELATFEKEPDAVTVTEEAMLRDGFGERPLWFGWVACGLENQKIRKSEDQKIRRSDDRTVGGSGDEEARQGELSDLLIPSFSDRILGLALCYDRYSTWKGRCLYLEDIVVTEAARGQGIGEALFRHCVRHGVEHGYHWMRWQVLDWNAGAIRFYERLGAEVSPGWLNGDLSAEQMRNLAAR